MTPEMSKLRDRQLAACVIFPNYFPQIQNQVSQLSTQNNTHNMVAETPGMKVCKVNSALQLPEFGQGLGQSHNRGIWEGAGKWFELILPMREVRDAQHNIASSENLAGKHTSNNHMFPIQPINVSSSLSLRISTLTYFIALQILQSSAHCASSGHFLTRCACLGSQRQINQL